MSYQQAWIPSRIPAKVKSFWWNGRWTSVSRQAVYFSRFVETRLLSEIIFGADLHFFFYELNLILIGNLAPFSYGTPGPWHNTVKENPRVGDHTSTVGKCDSTISGIYRMYLYVWNYWGSILDLEEFKNWTNTIFWSVKFIINSISK